MDTLNILFIVLMGIMALTLLLVAIHFARIFALGPGANQVPEKPADHGIMLLPDPPRTAEAKETPAPRQIQNIIRLDQQTQKILRCEELHLQVSIPVAEWFVIQRKLRSLEPVTWIDPESKCVAYLRPYILSNTFDVAVELAPINIGTRFQQISQEKKT